jgi:heterokaryon incompatibility protein (HET)
MVSLTCSDRAFLCHSEKPLELMPVSINQADNIERGLQVTTMMTIYRNAVTVRAWLGPDHSEKKAKFAVESIKKISKDVCDILKLELSEFRKSENIYNDIIRPNANLLPRPEERSYSTPELWDSVRWFFAHSWFSRLWIIQEVKSNKECFVHVGNEAIEWIELAVVPSYLFIDINFHKSTLQNASDEVFLRHALVLGSSFNNPKQWSDVLIDAAEFRASDTRDKIYGLVGILNSRASQFHIKADYNVTQEELYRHVMDIILLKDQNLNVLHRAGFDGPSEMASWIVRWDNKLPQGITYPNNHSWTAAGDKTLSHSINKEKSSLKLSGFVLDSIQSVVPVSHDIATGKSRKSDEKPITDLWSDVLREIGTVREGQDPLTACAMVFTAGMDKRRERVDETRNRADFAAYLRDLLGDKKIENINFKEAMTASLGKGDDFRWAAGLGQYGGERCFFRTSSGFLGYTRRVPQPEDLLCILFGGSYPFILRPNNEGYLLIDYAWVYGVMEGEMMAAWKAKKLPEAKEQDFEIH